VFKELNKLLADKNRKILFAGIGNVLKSDDGAGVYISSRIISNDNIKTLTVETGIENYIGKINSLGPDILVLIDCVDMKLPPGEFRLLNINQIQDLTFNTHNISLRRLPDFFEMPVFILAIQPENIHFGENISYIVRDISDNIINQINRQEE
jgi:hydrogenase 3 maturation protease